MPPDWSSFDFWLGALFAAVGFVAIKFLRRLSKRLGEHATSYADTLADWVNQRLSDAGVSYFFRRNYLKHLVFLYRSLDTEGLNLRGPYTMDLEGIYVPLRVSPQTPEKGETGLIGQAPKNGNLQVWNFLARRSAKRIQAIAIIGGPGSGKTTLLRHLTLVYAKRKPRRYCRSCRGRIPILLNLRELVKLLSRDAIPELPRLLQAMELAMNRPASEKWFKKQLTRGGCLILLDGLDEVAETAMRQTVSQWLSSQMKLFPSNMYLLTSRPIGYRTSPVAGIQLVLEIQRFSVAEVEQFIHRWYFQNELIRQARKPDRGIRDRAQRKATDLFRRIRNHPALTNLAYNPLLLTMIATVHDNTGVLPDSRVNLYREICQVLLANRKRRAPTEAPLSPDLRRMLLQQLAYALMVRKHRQFALHEAEELLSKTLMKATGGAVKAAEFVHDIEVTSGLIVEAEQGVYEFVHQSFQEYLASLEIKDTAIADTLVQTLLDPWWAETIRLYAAQSDASSLILSALLANTEEGLQLAYDLWQEGAFIDENAQKMLREKLDQSLSDDSVEVMKMSATVSLRRRRNSLYRVDDKRSVDPKPITCAEYQLFLWDCPTARDGYAPMSWLGTELPHGWGNRPVKALNAESRDNFLAWFNKEYGDPQGAFGLPTKQELLELSERAQVGAWIEDSRKQRLFSGESSSPISSVGAVFSLLNIQIDRIGQNRKDIAWAIGSVDTNEWPVAIDFGFLDHVNRELKGLETWERALDRAVRWTEAVARSFSILRSTPVYLGREMGNRLERLAILIEDLDEHVINGAISSWITGRPQAGIREGLQQQVLLALLVWDSIRSIAEASLEFEHRSKFEAQQVRKLSSTFLDRFFNLYVCLASPHQKGMPALGSLQLAFEITTP